VVGECFAYGRGKAKVSAACGPKPDNVARVSVTIEAGHLSNGDPDPYFRGFYCPAGAATDWRTTNETSMTLWTISTISPARARLT